MSARTIPSRVHLTIANPVDAEGMTCADLICPPFINRTGRYSGTKAVTRSPGGPDDLKVLQVLRVLQVLFSGFYRFFWF
jgi:hypothetical protein